MIQSARHTLYLLIIVAMLLALQVRAQSGVQLPDIGRTSTQVLSPEEQRTFPSDFERFLRANHLLIEDPLVSEYFRDMGYRLVSYSSRPGNTFHFFVIDDPNINAFAAPASVIGLHTGLILAAEDHSEIAGVIAHEIAHVTQDHLARGLENSQQVSLPTLLATIGLALAAGAAGAGGEASQAIMMSGLSLAQQFQINHTRQNEAEADRIGIALMAGAGYDPQGMTRFFERLSVISRPMGEGPPEYLRTHPLTVNRIAEARTRAEQLPVREPLDGGMFHTVQARLRALVSSKPGQAEDWFRARIAEGSRPENSMRYGLAFSLLREGRLDQARKELDALLASAPDERLYQLLEAKWLLAVGRQSETLDILESLYWQYPGNGLVARQFAQALMHDPDPARAARAGGILRQYLRHHENDVEMTELYARAADRAGQSVRAAEALAESYAMRGAVKEAIIQLERVSKRDDLDYYQRARVNARMEQLRAERLRLAEQAGR
ncbi:MAG: M48 family metallopeptidase [Pseudomonadota bacterium]|nr:MAG: M48 family metallopeptidase [Pseudomonadota bacterium]